MSPKYMTPEEQAALDAKNEAEQAPQDEEPTEEEPVEGEPEDEGKSKKNLDIDYEAEYEKEREAREKAEAKLAGKRFKESEKRRNQSEEEDPEAEEADESDEDDEDKPLTRRELAAMLERNTQQTRKAMQTERIKEIAKTLAGSDSEAKLIVEIHKGRTYPSHLTLEEQIEEAYIVTHRKKLIGERSEALRALKGKSGVVKNPASTHREVAPVSEPKTSSADVGAIKQAGYSWNGTSRRYEKKVNGGIIYRDPKTKATVFLRK